MIFDAFSQTLLTKVSHIISGILCAKHPLLIWQHNPHHSAGGEHPSALPHRSLASLSSPVVSLRECRHSLSLPLSPRTAILEMLIIYSIPAISRE